ncbi:MAG: hypothetical protein EBR82_32070, partial [Caulobacteraceae bacterium]|nr:hypothetical protein [Caulobacteraceae bacterium]
MKYILNIGCNVGNKAAFSPAFALSKVATMFENVHESASFRSSYEAEVDGKVQTVEENVLVVLVSEPFVEVGSSIFCLANVLDQKAIAYAPEGRTDLGALEGPHRDT